MLNTKKVLPVLLLCVFVIGSVYPFISNDLNLIPEHQLPDNDTISKKNPNKKIIVKNYTQDTYQDIVTEYPFDSPKPENVKSVVEYDANTGNYVFRTKVGDMEISTPLSMTPDDYRQFSAKNEIANYWKEKNSKIVKENEEKFSITDMKFNIGPADKIFGPGGVQVKTQGSAELVFGLKTNNVENPALTERMRKSTIFDFDEKIQLNVNGSVGDKTNFGLNYNTESTFEFDQQLVKLAYKGKEDDIIRNLQAGNVSMPLNSSLITGSTALFGVKTDLQFGKLSISAIASQQKSETKTVSSKGGSQTTDFEVNIDNYDDNRHFFISHYFRKKYESAMSKLPLISSGVTINRVEVWITNKRANYDQSRNIVAFMDLGESERIDNNYWKPIPTSDLSLFDLPKNSANTLYSEVSSLPNVRDIQQSNSVLANKYSGSGINGGEDYEKIESARRLESSEYNLNPALGIISLKSALNPDEVLGVAFEYSYGGKIYQVGEFSTDAVEAPNAMLVKLLKGTALSPQLALWDLMMKNVYSLGAMQIQPENFKLNIVFRNDSIGTDLQYITEGKIKNQLLLQVMNLDRLDSKNNSNPDGKFDFVEDYTAISSSGRIIFPVLEPFGSHLKKMIGNDAIASKYVFQELYDSTLIIAQELSEKNKFRITGEYKASSGSEIRLNAMNVPRGSVTVTAGGATLVENVDYTVDYTMGSVNILNQSILESGTNIDVKLENQSMFSMQRKSLLGTHLEYQFSNDFTLGGTIMHLSEMPLTTKVNTGNEPISNTIWGLNTAWRKESQWLTNIIDKIPFVNATQPSSLSLNAEFAQLIPGHHKVVGKGGYAYLDDFESTKTTIDIHYPVNWYLASTPNKFPEAQKSNDIEYGKNRALINWYYVDPLLNQDGSSTPKNLRNNVESQSNHYTRNVLIPEIFPNRETPSNITTRMTIMNLSYYPSERGPYNLDADRINIDGSLRNPQDRWGGIMRKLDVTDFETANIEYIEFWMMDPFIYNTQGTDKGGELYFNIGDISEDILKDGKKSFEHGLPVDGNDTKTDATVWGRVSRSQSTVTAFDNTSGARQFQDVGLNGISTNQEFEFPTYKTFIEQYKSKVNTASLQTQSENPLSTLNDPAGDDYQFYRSTYYDDTSADILTRYKRYNGTEGNSPDASNINENYTTTATSLPDIEDLNGDNTLNEYEKYFQYKVQIRPDKMKIGENYITSKTTSNVKLVNGNVEPVTWYQFKIPVREYEDKFGSIRNFKSIRFVRMFLTNFEKETHLRFATLDLVRGEWRSFTKDLFPVGKTPISVGKLDVQAVNVEENTDKTPVNYILPPGISREVDPGQPQLLQQNEQSMVLMVNDLAPADARAVYKSTSFDMRQYKRLQMFVHAEKMLGDVQNLKDYELTCFVRLGTDMVNNYYEYEIPLKLTPPGVYSSESEKDQATVWYPENMFDFSFETLTNAKLKRNKNKGNSSNVSNLIPYTVFDDNNLLNKITVKGNPTLSDVQNIMIGIRNVSNNIKSGEIWVNELRMNEFNEDGGWAAMANFALGLSDLGKINFSGRAETAGYGGIESNVMNRRMDDLYQMNFSTSLELGRFLPEKAKIQIPAYFSYTNETITPKYNPLDQDVFMRDALENMNTDSERDSLNLIAQTIQTSKSFNISSAKINVRSKKPQFYDPANVSVTYAYNETNQQSSEIQKNMNKQERGSLNYNFSFSAEPWEPFKKMKSLSKPAFAIIRDFNLNYMPQSISFNTDLSRQFSQTQLRDFNTTSAVAGQKVDLTFSKDFMWNRQFDIKFDLSKSLKFSLQTAMNANIEEYRFTPEIGKEYYEQWRDTVWASIRKLGTPFTYQQVFSASWTVPINKIPLFDWVTANASYNSTYSWNRTAIIEGAANIGNVATSMGAWQADGSLNFETLYNKSKYFKEVNRKFGNQVQTPQKFTPKTFKQTVNLTKNAKDSLKHKLSSQNIKLIATDKFGKPLKLSYKSVDPTTVVITSKLNVDSVNISIATLDPNDLPFGRDVIDVLSRLVMMTRRASVTYRNTSSMVLPGFYPEAGFLGQKKTANGLYAPGIAYAFGFHDENTIDNAIENKWLFMSDSIINPASTAVTSDWDIKASLEPIPGLKINLIGTRYMASNTTVQYMFPGMPQTFNGSYNITQVAILTAFKPTKSATDNYYSENFDNFLNNRAIFANRLNSKLNGKNYPNVGFFTELPNIAGKPYNSGLGTYNQNSSDVLIPAFLAAYSGKDPNKMDTNPFLSLLSMLPNWRLSYDGLSRIPWVKDNLKSISFTHGYTCRYSIGSYTSNSTWVDIDNDKKTSLGFIRDAQTDNPIPSSPFEISSVTLTEQFSPLIGINAAMKNSMTAKLEYRKERNFALNLASTQLIDASTNEFVVGMGYLVKDFDVILKLKSDEQSRIKNDLKLSADLSYKDIKTLLRKIDENLTQASNGNKLFTLRIIADYVFSSKVNIQLFYDRQMSTPLISSTFPVSSTNFGMSFKFMLTR